MDTPYEQVQEWQGSSTMEQPHVTTSRESLVPTSPQPETFSMGYHQHAFLHQYAPPDINFISSTLSPSLSLPNINFGIASSLPSWNRAPAPFYTRPPYFSHQLYPQQSFPSTSNLHSDFARSCSLLNVPSFKSHTKTKTYGCLPDCVLNVTNLPFAEAEGNTFFSSREWQTCYDSDYLPTVTTTELEIITKTQGVDPLIFTMDYLPPELLQEADASETEEPEERDQVQEVQNSQDITKKVMNNKDKSVLRNFAVERKYSSEDSQRFGESFWDALALYIKDNKGNNSTEDELLRDDTSTSDSYTVWSDDDSLSVLDDESSSHDDEPWSDDAANDLNIERDLCINDVVQYENNAGTDRDEQTIGSRMEEDAVKQGRKTEASIDESMKEGESTEVLHDSKKLEDEPEEEDKTKENKQDIQVNKSTKDE